MLNITFLGVAFLAWQGIGVVALSGIAYSTMVAQVRTTLTRQILTGMLFGGAGILAMLSPAEFSPGFIVDSRGALIGLGGALGGLPGAAVAGAVSLVVRYAMGGSGMVAGMVGIAMAACLGYAVGAWRDYSAGEQTLFGNLVFAAVVSLHTFSLVLLPEGDAFQLAYSLYAIAAVSYFVGITVLLAIVGFLSPRRTAPNAA